MIVIERVGHIGLNVSNLDDSLNFYQELFDFEVVERINNSNNAYIRVGDILICLYEVDGYRDQKGVKNRISFFIDDDDFDDALDELKEREISIVFGPENLKDGRRIVFLDPDKNEIELCYQGVK